MTKRLLPKLIESKMPAEWARSNSHAQFDTSPDVDEELQWVTVHPLAAPGAMSKQTLESAAPRVVLKARP